MDSVIAARIISNITKQFRLIGTSSDHLTMTTVMPKSTRNDESYIWELFIAKTLTRLADAREKEAKKAAIKAGCIRDYEKFPDDPHEAQTIYDGDNVTVTLSVSKPSETIDATMFANLLIAAGVDPAVIERAKKGAVKPRRGAHTTSCELNTN